MLTISGGTQNYVLYVNIIFKSFRFHYPIPLGDTKPYCLVKTAERCLCAAIQCSFNGPPYSHSFYADLDWNACLVNYGYQIRRDLTDINS
jgi:hypothetical protein